jgi:hypothetical protein
MGAILDLVGYVQTPIGAIAAILIVVALYFFGRWVLSD